MRERLRLSVVLITKNEAQLIGDCLASVQWADEIIVVDSGSQDETCALAQAAGAKVYTHIDWQGFGKQRQAAQDYASGEMILMIDADERVTPPLRAAIEQVLTQPLRQNKVFSIARSNWFIGRFMRHSGWYADSVIRLYPRHFHYNDDLVHESLHHPGAEVQPLDGDLQHLTCRDLGQFQAKQLAYAQAWAQQRFQAGKSCSLFSVYSHCLAAGFKTLILRAGFLDGAQGWILAMVNVQYTFNKYAILWALNQSR